MAHGMTSQWHVLGQVLRLAALTALAGGLLSACGGGGDSPPPPPDPGPGPDPGATVVVSGRITFDRIPFGAGGTGLDPAAVFTSPARQIVVEGIAADSETVVSTAPATTDLDGRYSLTVPAGRQMRVRARAQMSATNWDFRVLNNRNRDALYVLDSQTFDSGTANSTRNLHAPSDWTGTAYAPNRRAAPFAILDTVFRAKELIRTASPDAVFPPLNLFWSQDNRTVATFCPDEGSIVTTSYVTFAAGGVDQCDPKQPGVDGIYVLGDFANGAGDTDEYDQHVIAHEFGHYFEDKFARSDSIGGSHGGDSGTNALDLRLAFGEGWGNVYSAMVLGDPVYRDSFSGVSDDFDIPLETGVVNGEGWFSEFSIGEILWDVFDSDSSEPGSDAVALGFVPIYSVMTGPQVTTDAFTSIFSFASAIRAANPAAAPAIGALLNSESIFGTGEFGAGETNDGGDPAVLPIYRDITTAVPLGQNGEVCSRSTFGSEDANKLGNRVFLRFVNDSTRLVTIQVTGAATLAGSVAATDPDIFVFRQGVLVASGTTVEEGREQISQRSLEAGTYVIEVYDFHVSGTNSPPRCMTVSITG